MLIVFSALVSYLLLSAASAATAPLVQRWAAHLPPWHRSWALLVFALLPLVLTVLSVSFLFLPGLNLLVSGEHCHGNDCMAHPPHLAPEQARAATVAALVLGFPWLGVTLLTAMAVWRSTRLSLMLAGLAEQGGRHDYRTLSSRHPTAMCLGLLKPVVVVSQGLVQTLSRDAFQCVLLHEHAHALRFDNLRQLLASMGTLAWPRGRRRGFLQEMGLAAELACDAAVVSAGYAGEDVASAITEVSALVEAATGGVGSAGKQGCLHEALRTRCTALRNPMGGPVNGPVNGHGEGSANGRAALKWLGLGSATLLVLATLGTARLLHHAAEHILSLG